MAITRTLTSAAALGAGVALVITALPAHAATSYVALGDSYSSGTGTRSYIDDGTACQRSVYAYPSLLAASKGLSLNFRACSGAKVADVTNTQLSALGAGTTHVSISVGGNDAGFADVLTECAQPGWMSDCNEAIDGAQNVINNTLPGRLSTLYASISSKVPNARVTVVGYPRIFMGEDCNAGTWFSPDEQSRLNATADLLNSRTATQASAKGFAFANPTSAFTGHAVCDAVEWVNGLSSPISESYHPNKPGHQGYAGVVGPKLVGTAFAPSGSGAATLWAESLARQQRKYAAADSAIAPAQFRAPDLTTPEARAAAARAGVDLSSRASIDAADRRYSAMQSSAR